MRSALLVLAAVGCSPAAPAPPAPPTSAAAPTPAPSAILERLERLERRLLSARSFRVKARLASGGRIESHFDGTLVAGDGQRVRWTMQGAFGGKDLDATFLCDGAQMRGGTTGKRFQFDVAPGVREGIAVALVRMGMLHDVASLSFGAPPDFLDGKAKVHLTIVDPKEHAGPEVRGAPTEELSWTLAVDGKASADETLWLDARTELPVRRRVVVHFPEGDMDVGEEYDEVSVDEPEDDAEFRVTP